MSIEREVKLTAPEGLELPGLGGVLDGVTATRLPIRQLSAVYYDTADLLLIRSGVTLRHRAGEAGPAWTLKLPTTGSGTALERRELTFDAPPGEVPEEARDLVRAYVRSRPLLEVARLDTRRHPVRLCDAAGEPLAEVVDDEVTASTTSGPSETGSSETGSSETRRFREIEVEALSALREDAATILEATTRRLTASGCRADDGVPKLVRALGNPARRPPEVEVPELGQRSTVAELVRYSVARALETKIRRHDPGVRLGGDPEDVHQLRVGARRLRSDLQTYAALLDPTWVVRLRAELRWLGAEAGAVRDSDVLALRLRDQAAELDHPAAVEPVLRVLNRQAARERAEMLAALRGERYDALLDDLVAAYAEPRFAAKPTDLADRPARELAPKLVRKPWRRLRRAVNALEDDPPDTALHNVRILAKRCRYAAEAVAPVVGEDAARFAKAMSRIQSVLGDHQDAIVAERWLHTAGATITDADHEAATVVEELIALQRAERDRLRGEWREVWRAASARSLRRWL